MSKKEDCAGDVSEMASTVVGKAKAALPVMPAEFDAVHRSQYTPSLLL